MVPYSRTFAAACGPLFAVFAACSSPATEPMSAAATTDDTAAAEGGSQSPGDSGSANETGPLGSTTAVTTGDGESSEDSGGVPGGCGQGRPPDGPTHPFDPTPALAAIPEGVALDLGLYTCADRMPQIAHLCETITDYSRINYDPYMHRVLMFGGGHAATGRTDVDVFDLEDLTWSSMYPSMSCDEVAAGNIDPRGFHIATGHPVARHSYDQNVVAEVGGVGRFLTLSNDGTAGTCHQYNAPTDGVAFLPLDGCTTWSYSHEFVLPWSHATGVEFDPISGMVIILGDTVGAGEGGMWVFDPATHTVVTFVDEVQYAGIDGNLVYYPPNDHMYLMQVNGNVWDVTLDRGNWSASASVLRSPSGSAPSSHAYAYDGRAQVIGGAINDGVFNAFDPQADQWCSESIAVESAQGASVGTVTAHELDYDPINNVYILIAHGPDGQRTWAYRFRD